MCALNTVSPPLDLTCLALDITNTLKYFFFLFKMPATRTVLQLTGMVFSSDEFSGINYTQCV